MDKEIVVAVATSGRSKVQIQIRAAECVIEALQGSVLLPVQALENPAARGAALLQQALETLAGVVALKGILGHYRRSWFSWFFLCTSGTFWKLIIPKGRTSGAVPVGAGPVLVGDRRTPRTAYEWSDSRAVRPL